MELATRPGKDQPAGRMDSPAGVGVHRDQRTPIQSALRRRLDEHRVRTLHSPGGGRSARAQREMGWGEETGMWDSPLKDGSSIRINNQDTDSTHCLDETMSFKSTTRSGIIS